MTEERAGVGAVELAYESIGDPADPALLLVMGLGMQLIHWDLELCEGLAERGFHVIRFDNRDAGLSTKIDAPVPNVMRAMAGFPIHAPYLLVDMADDSFGLLDKLGIERAHVVGASMGGMIAQTMAIRRPDRVLSLGSMMSTTGDRRVGRPKLRVWSVLMRRAPQERDAYIDYFVRVFRMIGSPSYPVDEPLLREQAAATYDRCHHPAGTARQMAATLASGSRTDGPEEAGGADRRDPREGRSAHTVPRRRGHRQGDPRRRAGGAPRHGPQPPARVVAALHGRAGQEC